jgi:DNA-binding NarL/FixJ family response regulator
MTNRLTPREHDVLRCIAEGQTTKQIANTLGISFKTAACHRYHVLSKLDASNAADLVCRAARLGLINIAPEPSAARMHGVLLTPHS